MIPAVTQLLSLGVYRDGGSISASFLGQDPTIQYCLFFPIARSHPSLDKRKYGRPELKIYRTVPYVSKVTGLSTPSTEQERSAVSWSEAAVLLAAIKPYMSSFKSNYLWVYDAMVSAASESEAQE
jgi:hypothetical protein